MAQTEALLAINPIGSDIRAYEYIDRPSERATERPSDLSGKFCASKCRKTMKCNKLTKSMAEA